MLIVHDVRLYSVLDTVVISGEDVCCSVVFGTLVGVSVFSVMWSKLLMTSAISCPLWSALYECQRVECAFTYPVRTECAIYGRMYICCIVNVMLSLMSVMSAPPALCNRSCARWCT